MFMIKLGHPAEVASGILDLTPYQVEGILTMFYFSGISFELSPYNAFPDLISYLGKIEEPWNPNQEDLQTMINRINKLNYPTDYQYYLFLAGQNAILVYGFDNLEILQGILSVCQWLQKDCRDIIKIYDRNEQLMIYT